MKLPRDESANDLIKRLSKLGFYKPRQIGSHIRLTRIIGGHDQHLTIPNHNPILIGTLSDILKDVAFHLKISKEELISILYS